MNTLCRLLRTAGASTLLLSTLNPQLSTCFAQGSLTPPGAPAPTMRTLQQVEPRIPISSLPFTIVGSGSYYLTDNLIGLGTPSITISADDVTLDLNGFVIVSAGGPPLRGIEVPLARRNLVIRNGTIINWGACGLYAPAANSSRFENLRIVGNGYAASGGGMIVGTNCTVSGCVFDNNTGAGLTLGSSGAISGCTFAGNTGYGVDGGAACVSRGSSFTANMFGGLHLTTDSEANGCTATRNNGVGIYLEESGRIKDCGASFNVGNGILARRGGIITGCTIRSNSSSGLNLYENCAVENCVIEGNNSRGIDGFPANEVADCTVVANAAVGILVTDGSTVRNCTVKGNGGDGIQVTSDCAVLENNCSGNGGGTDAGIRVSFNRNRIDGNHVADNSVTGILVLGGNNLVVRNSACSNATQTVSFNISTGNTKGEIIVNGGGFGVTLTSASSAWANIVP